MKYGARRSSTVAIQSDFRRFRNRLNWPAVGEMAYFEPESGNTVAVVGVTTSRLNQLVRDSEASNHRKESELLNQLKSSTRLPRLNIRASLAALVIIASMLSNSQAANDGGPESEPALLVAPPSTKHSEKPVVTSPAPSTTPSESERELGRLALSASSDKSALGLYLGVTIGKQTEIPQHAFLKCYRFMNRGTDSEDLAELTVAGPVKQAGPLQWNVGTMSDCSSSTPQTLLPKSVQQKHSSEGQFLSCPVIAVCRTC